MNAQNAPQRVQARQEAREILADLGGIARQQQIDERLPGPSRAVRRELRRLSAAAKRATVVTEDQNRSDATKSKTARAKRVRAKRQRVRIARLAAEKRAAR